jgi:hypothetical protein
MTPRFFAALLLIIIVSFKDSTGTQNYAISNVATKTLIQKGIHTDSLRSALRQNLDFFARHLLHGHSAVIRRYMRKYQPDSCMITTYKNSNLKINFEGVKVIKSIFVNEKADTIFVIPPFNYCDDGESYCFYNKALPRLYTDSYCCHPYNLFVLPDIDGDGVREIGIYYSSCASRFKALIIYSLKGGSWKKIASSMFDTFMKNPEKTRFNTLVRKISKGKFKICDFADGKTEWKNVVMK